MKINYRILIPLLIISIFSVGCAQHTSVLIDKSTCHPSCWNGIVPGYTISTEGLQYLYEIPEINQSSIYVPERDSGNGFIAWDFISGYSERTGRYNFDNYEISLIQIFMHNHVDLSKFIEGFGEPDIVSIIPGWGEAKYYEINLIYSDYGIALNTTIPSIFQSRSHLSIRPKLRVEKVFYFEPSTVISYSDSYIYFDAPNLDIFQFSYQSWNGYGKYKIIDWE